MPLANENKKRFRSIGHELSPIVTVAGNGLSDSVIAELERALTDHELIKVKLAVAERELRREVAKQICDTVGAEMVQEIGKIILIYRHNPKANIKLSNIKRAAVW